MPSISQVSNNITRTTPGKELGGSVSICSINNIPYIAIGASSRYSAYVYKLNLTDSTWVQVGPNISDTTAGSFFGFKVSIYPISNIPYIAISTQNGNYVRVYKYNSSDATWIKVGSDIVLGDTSVLVASISSSNDNIPYIILGHRTLTLVRVLKYNSSDATWVHVGTDIVDSTLTYFGFDVSISFNDSNVPYIVGSSTGSIQKVYRYDSSTSNWVQAGANIAKGGNSKIIFNNNIPYILINRSVYTFNSTDSSWNQVGIDISNNIVGGDSGSICSVNNIPYVIIANTNINKVAVYSYSSSVWTQINGNITNTSTDGYTVSITSVNNIPYFIIGTYYYMYENNPFAAVYIVNLTPTEKPTINSITISNNSVILSWTNATGITLDLKYTITTVVTSEVGISNNASPYTIPNTVAFINNISYTLSLHYYNSGGNGPDASGNFTYYTRPSNPTISAVSFDNTTFTINYSNAPVSPITGVFWDLSGEGASVSNTEAYITSPASIVITRTLKNSIQYLITTNYVNGTGNTKQTSGNASSSFTFYTKPTFATLEVSASGFTIGWTNPTLASPSGITGIIYTISGPSPFVTLGPTTYPITVTQTTTSIPLISASPPQGTYNLTLSYSPTSGSTYQVTATSAYGFKELDITNQTTLLDTSIAPRKYLYLPPVSEYAGAILNIKDKGYKASVNTITISRNRNDSLNVKIDGADTFLINTDGGAVILSSNGYNWFIHSFFSGSINNSFATYDTITEPTGTNIKLASPYTQIHRVILTTANYMLILPPPDNTIHIVIGANALAAYYLYIKSENGVKIHNKKYISLRSDGTGNQKNVGLILFGDSASNEWYILGGMFAYSTDNSTTLFNSFNTLYTTARLPANSKEKKNETQITYFSNASSNEIRLNLAIPLNSAAVLYFKNTTSVALHTATLFTPISGNTNFNGQTGYYYLYTGMNGGSIIVGLNDAGTITYYMIGNQL